jgi:transcriptional regulator with XRE-family HTH domain
VTNDLGLSRISETVGRQVTRLRKGLGWSVEQLAERCTQAGAPELTVNAIYVIESGRKDKATGRRRRHVTVDELLTLAVAFGVTPVDLLVPSTVADDEPYHVAPKVAATAGTAREWIGGLFLKAPESPAELAEAIRWMPKSRASAVASEWLRTHHTELMRQTNAAEGQEEGEVDD